MSESREVEFRGTVTWEQHYGDEYRARLDKQKRRAQIVGSFAAVASTGLAILIIYLASQRPELAPSAGNAAGPIQRFSLVSGDKYGVCRDFAESLDSSQSGKMKFEWPLNTARTGISKPEWRDEAPLESVVQLFLLSHLRGPSLSDANVTELAKDSSRILSTYWSDVRGAIAAGKLILSHTSLRLSREDVEDDLYRLSPASFGVATLKTVEEVEKTPDHQGPWLYLALPKSNDAVRPDLLDYRDQVSGQYDSVLYHQRLFLIGRNFPKDQRLQALWNHVLASRQEQGLGAHDAFALLDLQKTTTARMRIVPLCVIADNG